MTTLLRCATPLPLLVEWLELALASDGFATTRDDAGDGIPGGEPSARALLLEDFDDEALWFAYRVILDSVEFWQAERERDQVRLRYRRTADPSAVSDWTKELLWP